MAFQRLGPYTMRLQECSEAFRFALHTALLHHPLSKPPPTRCPLGIYSSRCHLHLLQEQAKDIRRRISQTALASRSSAASPSARPSDRHASAEALQESSCRLVRHHGTCGEGSWRGERHVINCSVVSDSVLVHPARDWRSLRDAYGALPTAIVNNFQ